MEHSQTARLLKYIHSLQGGELSPVEVDAWHSIVGRLDYDEALEAARAQVTASTDRVKPAHIIGRVQAARNREVGHRPIESVSDEATGKPVWFDEAIRAAAEATRRCVERGYGRGDRITVRSAWAAADHVRQRAEAGAREPEGVVL